MFVGACLGSGAANQVLAAGWRDEHTPLMGTALLMEYEDVLGRGDLFADCRLGITERNELFDILLAHCRCTRIVFLTTSMSA